MLQLDYDVFIDHYEKQKQDKNQDFRRLHYLESSDKFTLYLKSQDYWEYTTEILKSDIIEFGAKYEATPEQAIIDYKMNVLHGAMPLENKEVIVQDLEEELQPVTKETTNKVPKTNESVEKEETLGYAEFLEGKFKQWRREVLGFLESSLEDENLEKEFVQKTIGVFITRLFNVVNTRDFFEKLRKVITVNVKQGIEEAEEDTGLDIGFGIEFRNNVDNLVTRQIDGFYIDGKRWKGLKGVSAELQQEISKIVRKGVIERSSIKSIKEGVNKSFDKFTGTKVTEGRAMKIARTEANRFRSASRLEAYKRAGVEGELVWDATLDNRTSDICERLHGQRVKLGEQFHDDVTGESFSHPPSHVSCRSQIKFILSE